MREAPHGVCYNAHMPVEDTPAVVHRTRLRIYRLTEDDEAGPGSVNDVWASGTDTHGGEYHVKLDGAHAREAHVFIGSVLDVTFALVPSDQAPRASRLTEAWRDALQRARPAPEHPDAPGELTLDAVEDAPRTYPGPHPDLVDEAGRPVPTKVMPRPPDPGEAPAPGEA